MIELDNSDIQAHIFIARQLDKNTLGSIISSINSEYDEIKTHISSKERANYQKLLDIYSDELMSRYAPHVSLRSNLLH